MAFIDDAIESLRETSRLLARSEEARLEFAAELEGSQDALRKVEQIWKEAVEKREPSGGMNEEGKLIEVSIVEAQDEQLERAILCARILRNAAVGSERAQEILFSLIPAIMDVLWMCTSFSHASDTELQALTRSLVQLLSNTITQNDHLQERFWMEVLQINAEETVSSNAARTSADLFGRLVQFKDFATSTAAVILLINCTLNSAERSESICKSSSGGKVLRATLTAIQAHMDKDDEEAEPESNGGHNGEIPSGESSASLSSSRKQHNSLDVFYNFFANLFDRQLFGLMYDNLASTGPDDGGDDFTPLVSQAQLTVLRFFDSYLHLGAVSYGGKTSQGSISGKDLPKLLEEFDRLASWAEGVMAKSIKVGKKEEIDTRLVDVHVALILLLQCLITIGLKTEETSGDDTQIKRVARLLLSEMRNVTFVQKLVSLLRTLAQFAPPVSPFKSTAPASTQFQQPPEGHTFTSTGRANANALSHTTEGGPGLDNLKRDIINLLGVLAYERGSSDRLHVRQVQDTVRESGGLLEVLSLTQIDERNPYIRERAIFTLRALLQGNEQSQGLIAQLKPTSSPSAAT